MGGDFGHLSNAAAAQYAAASARAGTHTILLAHLSQENNRPQLALETASAALEEAGWTGAPIRQKTCKLLAGTGAALNA